MCTQQHSTSRSLSFSLPLALSHTRFVRSSICAMLRMPKEMQCEKNEPKIKPKINELLATAIQLIACACFAYLLIALFALRYAKQRAEKNDYLPFCWLFFANWNGFVVVGIFLRNSFIITNLHGNIFAGANRTETNPAAALKNIQFTRNAQKKTN